MQSLTASLPEYPAAIQMFGVVPVPGPQFMAEIGDVHRFHSKRALVAFAGIDALPYQSGQMDLGSDNISKRSSAALHRALALVMGSILRSSPVNEPVYQFMNKKRAKGKSYRAYMMASANKFLRIYYAAVKQHLACLKSRPYFKSANLGKRPKIFTDGSLIWQGKLLMLETHKPS